MLAAWHDDLHYYDGNVLEVRLVSPDFHEERSLGKGFVCSPIAAAERIYCAQVEGLFEVGRDGAPPRRLTDNGGGLIAALAAGPTGVAWVSDAGNDQLTVKWLPR